MTASTKYASTRFGIVKRSKGQSAVDAASYISRSVLYSEYDGRTYRPKYKEDLVHCEVSLPANAPGEWADREKLWNSVELNEKQKNSQLCRTLKAALPNDWSYELAEEAVRDYVRRNFISKGMCADWALHDSVNPQGVHNLHFHVLLTLRPVGEDGKWGAKQRKEYILDKDGNKIRNRSGRGFRSRAVDVNDWNDKGNSRKWRKDLVDTINAVNSRIGLQEFWEHRSFKELGMEQQPTVHLGPVTSALERKGIRTEKGDRNREILEQNRALKRAKMFYDICNNSVENLAKWEKEQAEKEAKEAAARAAEKEQLAAPVSSGKAKEEAGDNFVGPMETAENMVPEMETAARGHAQEAEQGTSANIITAVRNEILEMLDRIVAVMGRLHLPLVQAPNFKKITNRAAVTAPENVRRFVEEKGFTTFEELEAFAKQQEQSRTESEGICRKDGEKLRRLKELAEAYAEYEPYILIRNEYLKKKGLAQILYRSQHKQEFEAIERLRPEVYRLMEKGEGFTPKKWQEQIRELTQEYEKHSRRCGRCTLNLAYVELIRHNRKVDEREQDSRRDSHSRSRSNNRQESCRDVQGQAGSRQKKKQYDMEI